MFYLYTQSQKKEELLRLLLENNYWNIENNLSIFKSFSKTMTLGDGIDLYITIKSAAIMDLLCNNDMFSLTMMQVGQYVLKLKE